jgi:hypothetical protein
MEFPITRVRLQNIHSERQQLIKTKYIDDVVEAITEMIIANADRGGGVSTFIGHNDAKPNTFQIMLNTLSSRIPHRNLNLLKCGVQACIPGILRKVQERFPDTTIVLDPMNTYIYIDWS